MRIPIVAIILVATVAAIALCALVALVTRARPRPGRPPQPPAIAWQHRCGIARRELWVCGGAGCGWCGARKDDAISR